MKMNGFFWAIIVLLAIGITIGGFAVFKPSATQQSVTTTTAGGQVSVPVGCNQNPVYTYSAKDTQSTSLIGGTDYIKADELAPVTTLTNPSAGDTLQYWKDNSSYFVEVANVPTVLCGSHAVQTRAYAYASSTIKAKDLDNDVFLTNGGGVNLTLGSNGLANVEVRVQGTSKYSSAPFGGCIAVEYPSTLTSVTLTGAGLTGNACPYTWTYTTQSTGNSYKMLETTKDFDADGSGIMKSANLQLKAGSTNPSGMIYITLQPANNYIGNDGKFYIGIEKDKNQDTTKTFANAQTFSFQVE
jgi:hypothetical protein